LRTQKSLSTLYANRQDMVRYKFLMGKSGLGKTGAILSRIAQQMYGGGALLFCDPRPIKQTTRAIYNLGLCKGREQDFRLLEIHDPEKSHTANFRLKWSTDKATSTICSIFSSGPSENDSSKQFRQQWLSAVSNRIGCINFHVCRRPTPRMMKDNSVAARGCLMS
jgi:hypothetical protein